uniref:Uncharacterized protein n=1 Tax=Strongyloides stercoralis TaxID=6248 RepID=A0A0K0DT06_STRER
MLLSLFIVATLFISSIYGYLNNGIQNNNGIQQHNDVYLSPYDDDSTELANNLNFYNTYVQTHPYQPDFYHNHHHFHDGFDHFPQHLNFGLLGGKLPPPKSPYEFCFKPIYIHVVRSNQHFISFCTRYAKHINRAPLHPKVPSPTSDLPEPIPVNIEGSGIEDFL